jgi:hypothetical protein
MKVDNEQENAYGYRKFWKKIHDQRVKNGIS